ncbi:MAG: TetR/AcrR family transcriptional regulator [Bacteroidales bacterium]|jgi:AcrR family transcriptional regulator|nr:TetR/AcrR family transcriptional regulator [Bacteroidales bacterium]
MSPRTPYQFEEMREEKKNLIMDTALEHFSNQGFQSTTITQIARHAGISKGLMYNYFRSKEDLLAAIINRSLADIYGSFNPDRDSLLTTEEFELFIRKVFDLFREKRKFWKLIYRVMMQQGVYENLLSDHPNSFRVGEMPLKDFSADMIRLMTDYFTRKGEKDGPDYDPVTEMLMFSNTLKGFALTYIFAPEQYPDEYFNKTVDALIMKYR